jgi:DNA-binding transcriptional LysR family regulator
MTLKQLEAFLWSARLGSFAVAALRLHVTQSSLSKRISELEADLGRQLFNRSGQRAVITEAGTQLLPYATQMLEMEAQARSAVDVGGSLRGHCRFGISELVASTWLPRLVARVHAQHPALVLEPHVDLTRGLERRVERGELDFAVIPGPSALPALAHHPIADLQYAWMAAPSRLAAGTVLTPQHFAEHPVVTLTAESTLTQAFNRWASQQQLEIPRALVCNSLLALIGLTTAGVGISFFPRVYMRALLQSGRLVELVSEPALPDLRYCFHWRRDDGRRLVALMQDLVVEQADFTVPSVMQATGT